MRFFKFSLSLLLYSFLAGSPVLTLAQASFDTADKYYEDASQRASAGDYDAAIIQLKNALQVEKGHLPAMLLMGRTYLAMGDPFEASVILSDALLQGIDPEVALPDTLDAYLNAQRYRALLAEIKASDAPHTLRADVLAARAQANLGIGRFAEARKQLELAFALERENLRAQLVRVSLLLQQGAREDALAQADILIERRPNDTRSWNSYASSLHALGQLESAIVAYERAVMLEPGNVDARVALVDLLMELRRNNMAKPHIDALREVTPLEPRGAYYSALYAARSNDSQTEQEELVTAVSLLESMRDEALNTNPQLLMIAALATYGLEAHERSLTYIDGYLALRSQDASAIRLKATILLALQDSNSAIQTLLPLHQRYPRDTATTSLLAAAYSDYGEHARAAVLLTSIANSASRTTSFDAQLGYALLNSGEVDEGVEILEQVHEQAPEREDIAVQLSIAYLRAGRHEDVLRVLDRLADVRQSDTEVLNMRAIALGSLERTAEAEAIYRDILATTENDLTALVNLAGIERQRGEIDKARQLLAQAQEAYPDYASPLIEASKLALAVGDADTALRLAERATEIEDTNAAVWQIVRSHLATGDLIQAEEVARHHAARHEDDLAASAILGRIFVIAGKPRQAGLVYTQMARRPDITAEELYRISQLQVGIGALDSASLSLIQALQRNDRHYQARLAQLQVEKKLKQYTSMAELAALFERDFPGNPNGSLAMGEAKLGLAEYPAAERAFKRAVADGAFVEGTLGRVRAMLAVEDYQAVEQLLNNSLESGERSLRLEAAWTDLMMMLERWEQAHTALTDLLTKIPRSPVHLNNRAVARQKLGMLTAAEEDARASLALNDANAIAQDTLGWILVEAGRADEAMPYLREAMARQGSDPSIRFHLAAALAQLGREREALKELYSLFEAGEEFPELGAAKALESSLQ